MRSIISHRYKRPISNFFHIYITIVKKVMSTFRIAIKIVLTPRRFKDGLT
nr:MAG TPA: hypothetical protein [Bacteriophage sp.]